MSIDELIGYLQTFEINLDETKRNESKGEKSIALQVTKVVPTNHGITIEKLHEHIALLTQNFNKAFKNRSKRSQRFEKFKNAQQGRSNELSSMRKLLKLRRKGFSAIKVIVLGTFRQSVQTP